jgi:hypothetical protein
VGTIIEAVRSEQDGRRPARTIYAIKEDEWELAVLRDTALRDSRPHRPAVV